MLHEIFQRTGRMPHEVYNSPSGSKRMMYASMAVELEDERKRDANTPPLFRRPKRRRR